MARATRTKRGTIPRVPGPGGRRQFLAGAYWCPVLFPVPALAVIAALAGSPAPDVVKQGASDGSSPDATTPRVTIWARAGGVGWTECEAHVRLALEFEGATLASAHANAVSAWSERAERCPHAPAVLSVAARIELARRVDVDSLGPESGSMRRLMGDYRRQRSKARDWMATALTEADRRGVPAPRGAHHDLAQILISLGDLPGARRALARAVMEGEVPRWSLDRTRAVLAIQAGELGPALAWAHAAVRDAPRERRREASYVLAYVLDRVGSWGEALTAFRTLRRIARDGRGLWALDGMLPLQEKLYLRALDHHANDEPGPAMRLYGAYLEHPDVAAPERRLAERHVRALAPSAPLVGGPG